jgi:hypothetical protein
MVNIVFIPCEEAEKNIEAMDLLVKSFSDPKITYDFGTNLKDSPAIVVDGQRYQGIDSIKKFCLT